MTLPWKSIEGGEQFSFLSQEKVPPTVRGLFRRRCMQRSHEQGSAERRVFAEAKRRQVRRHESTVTGD